MNTYIKQLIDAYGNNLIPVSGTASCYNSDGLTVDEIIENLKSSLQSVIPITWAGLKALKSSKLLSPGTIYCITDYKTVSTQSGTTTTGNGMQILVQALSKNTLSEDALGLLEHKSSGGGGGNTSIQVDFDEKTITIKKLLMGDDRDEENPGVYMIDEGGYSYLFHDMYELGGETYFRWIRSDVNSDDALVGPTDNAFKPLFILTSVDEFDFSGGQYYEPDFSITFDCDSGDRTDYECDKVIMGMETVTAPFRLYGDKFNPDDGDFPIIMDASGYWAYDGDLELDGTTYYRWAKYENGVNVSEENDAPYMMTDTLEYTFDEVESYEPTGFITYEGDDYDPENPRGNPNYIKITDNNYKLGYGGGSGGGSGKIEILDLKYSLDTDSRFTWLTQNEAYEIYTDDEYWFTLDGTMDIDGTTYYRWYAEDMGENSRLLSTTLNLNLSNKVDYIGDITDTSTFEPEYSTIMDLKANQVSPSGFSGVIYYMKDTNNNEAPYDFKNIIFSGHYTFDLSGTDYSSSSYCYENIIKPYRKSGQLILNNVVFLNENDDEYCKANYIEPDTHDISYGPGTSDLDTRLILGEY